MILWPLYYPITRHCTALIHRNTLVRCSCKKNKGIYHLEFSVPVVSVTEECHDFTRKTRILFRVSPHPSFFLFLLVTVSTSWTYRYQNRWMCIVGHKASKLKLWKIYLLIASPFLLMKSQFLGQMLNNEFLKLENDTVNRILKWHAK